MMLSKSNRAQSSVPGLLTLGIPILEAIVGRHFADELRTMPNRIMDVQVDIGTPQCHATVSLSPVGLLDII